MPRPLPDADDTPRGDVASGADNPLRRQRVPAPVLRRRLPSGRGAMEQPNASGDGSAPLTTHFWILLVVTGVITGLLGGLLMDVLFVAEHLAFGYTGGQFQTAVVATSSAHRVIALIVSGLITLPAWYLTRRLTAGQKSDIDDAIWNGTGELSLPRSLVSSVISEIAVGSGASLGREAAPKLMGAVTGSVLATWRGLSPGQRRLLVACGGGAGMAAVYNVPLGGALIAAELLYGSLALPVVLPALLCSGVATASGWLLLGDHLTYPGLPLMTTTPAVLVCSLVLGPVIGLLSVAYIRLIGWASHHRLRGWHSAAAGPVGFGLLGVAGIWLPQLFGNGQDMAHDAFVGSLALGILLLLAALKPLMTAMCLGIGATGGLFTPTLSIGAVVGAATGVLWSLMWPGSPVPEYAVVGAAAMIGAGTQAPISAIVLVLELTGTTSGLIVPMLVACGLATALSRYLDGYSIYSARLPA